MTINAVFDMNISLTVIGAFLPPGLTATPLKGGIGGISFIRV